MLNKTAVGFPVVQYLYKMSSELPDDGLRDKYLRLRKILTHFRSHSKGALAKFADKVDHDRVAGKGVCQAVLRKLIEDGVLHKEGLFYFVDQEAFNAKLGVSWIDLRTGVITEKLVGYLSLVRLD